MITTFATINSSSIHNISKILLKTSTAHVNHTTTSIFDHLSKGTKVVLQVYHLA